MSDLDEFLSGYINRQVKAEESIHNGNPLPRIEMWPKKDPVTLFGAWRPCKNGSEEVTEISRWVASQFSNCTEYRLGLVVAGVSGDMAHTVGYEHSLRSVNGGPVEPGTLRATHIYRRKIGEWKIVHHH